MKYGTKRTDMDIDMEPEWNLARFDRTGLFSCTKRSQGVGGVLSCLECFLLSLFLCLFIFLLPSFSVARKTMYPSLPFSN
jgi:hypothetical protein